MSTETLTQTTATALREGIIEGRYAPGTRLRERDLSAELGVSRLPVREALRALEREGFLSMSAHRGATVRTMPASGVAELFDMRLRLEPFAAEEAARRHAEGHIHPELETAYEAAVTATESGDRQQILITTADFHAQIIAASRHELLIEMMTSVLARTRWLFAMTAFRDPEPELHAHLEIYRAIREGQTTLAGMLMAAHIEAGRVPSIAAISAAQEGSDSTEVSGGVEDAGGVGSANGREVSGDAGSVNGRAASS